MGILDISDVGPDVGLVGSGGPAAEDSDDLV